MTQLPQNGIGRIIITIIQSFSKYDTFLHIFKKIGSMKSKNFKNFLNVVNCKCLYTITRSEL